MKNSISTRSYVAGFIFSLSLTFAAFLIVWRYVDSNRQILSEGLLLAWISGLALVQLFTQLIFFLHLGREARPRWNLSVLAFAAIVIVILVFGSLWIMISLDNRGGHTMTPQQTETYIIEDEGLRP